MSKTGGRGTHILVKVHEVGDHLDVWVIDPGLADDLLQDVAQSGREDEHGHVVLMEAVKELLVSLPVEKRGRHT